MGFNRDLLPDPLSFYESTDLRFIGRGKWRTTSCAFHGGSDSMRINMQSGAFVCMAGCGARGGDVLAYHMALHGMEFIEAAKALGAWLADGKAGPTRPTPLSPRAALEVLKYEAMVVAVAGGNVANMIKLSEADRSRLMQAASRIHHVAGMFA